MIAASTSSASTGCSVTAAARSGRLQISSSECLRANLPVRLHVPARLAHKPDRPDVGGTTPAGIEKTTRHWSHAHH